MHELHGIHDIAYGFNVTDDGRLERWLIRCKNSMEKMKKTLDLYYTLRTVSPEIMGGWDVNEPWFDSVCESW